MQKHLNLNVKLKLPLPGRTHLQTKKEVVFFFNLQWKMYIFSEQFYLIIALNMLFFQ